MAATTCFRFRIRTASGGIVNVSVDARDRYEAEYKLQKRYPGCTILSGG